MTARTDPATLELIATEIRDQVEQMYSRIQGVRESREQLRKRLDDVRRLLDVCRELRGMLHVYGVLAGAPVDDPKVSPAGFAEDLLGIEIITIDQDVLRATD